MDHLERTCDCHVSDLIHRLCSSPEGEEPGTVEVDKGPKAFQYRTENASPQMPGSGLTTWSLPDASSFQDVD